MTSTPPPRKPSPLASPLSQTTKPTTNLITVPLTPTYLAQASAYHINSLASPVHASAQQTPTSQQHQQHQTRHLDTIRETAPLSPLTFTSTSAHPGRDDPHHPRAEQNDNNHSERDPEPKRHARGASSNFKGLTLKPALRIRTAGGQDSATFFRAWGLRTAPPVRLAFSRFSRSPPRGRQEREDGDGGDEETRGRVVEVADGVMETGEAFARFEPKREGVRERLMRAWPWGWNWRMRWKGEGYSWLDHKGEGGLLGMVARRGGLKDGDRLLLRMFVALLAGAVVLQIMIVFGVTGLGCDC